MTARTPATAADTDTDPGPAPARDVALSAGMHFEGLLVLPTTARIDGSVRGEVLAHESVEVGATGVVWADLEAAEVIVEGRVEGSVRARDAVSLGPGAVVEGDLVAPKLVMAEGARIDGRCHCGASPAESASRREEAPSRPLQGPSAS